MTRSCSAPPRVTPPLSIEEPPPDPESRALMMRLDRLRPAMRALVHEYGAVIVLEMIAEGYSDPEELRDTLETWRERRHAAWMAEIPYPRKVS
jgi:hypothetical protein